MDYDIRAKDAKWNLLRATYNRIGNATTGVSASVGQYNHICSNSRYLKDVDVISCLLDQY